MQKPTIAVVALVAGLTGSGPVHSSAPPAAPNGIENDYVFTHPVLLP